MRLMVVLIFCLLSCSLQLFAGGGNGGPIVAIGFSDYGTLNKYTESMSIPPFNSQYYLWGGAGTSWLSRGFGLGMSVVGGYQMKFRDDFSAYAAIYTALLSYNIENILYEGKGLQFSLKYGPGFITDHFVLVSAGARSEFGIDSMLFNVGFTSQIKITEVTRIEFALNYNFVPGKDWVKLSGSGPQPESTRLDNYSIFLGIRFGSSFLASSGGGVYIPPSSSSPAE